MNRGYSFMVNSKKMFGKMNDCEGEIVDQLRSRITKLKVIMRTYYHSPFEWRFTQFTLEQV